MGATTVGGGGEGAWGRCSVAGVAGVLQRHPLQALFACGLLLFMVVEYTIPMVRPGAPPLDLGFVTTQGMHNAGARPWGVQAPDPAVADPGLAAANPDPAIRCACLPRARLTTRPPPACYLDERDGGSRFRVLLRHELGVSVEG